MAVRRQIPIIKSIKAPHFCRPNKKKTTTTKKPNKHQGVSVWNEHLYINVKVTHVT